MEDLLSLEDEVLQDSYLYHLPPDPLLIRVPPLLWARLKSDMEEYLVEYTMGYKVITKWYHRQFWETAEKRYLSPATKILLHSNMVDYFTGKWHDCVKPITFSKKKKGIYNDAKRGIPEMPCVYEKNAYNHRKLMELPYHLTQCKRHVDFGSFVCYDFDFLYYKCKAFTVQQLTEDLMKEKAILEQEIQVILDREEEERKRREREKKKRKAPDMDGGKTIKIEMIGEEEEEFIENRNDEEEEVPVKTPLANLDIFQLTSIQPLTLAELRDSLNDVQLIIDMLVLGFDAINKDPDNFLLQVMGQLGSHDSATEGLNDVRSKARAFVTAAPSALLVPMSKCMPAPGSELKTSIDTKIGFKGDPYDLENKVSMSQDGKLLYVVERNSNTSSKSLKSGNCGDFMRIHDLMNNGIAISMETLPGMDIKRMHLVGGDRYIYFQVYKPRTGYNSPSFTCVVDTVKHQPLPFTPDTKVIGFSTSGRYCLIVEPYYRTDKKQSGLGSREKSNVADKDDLFKKTAENEISTQTETSGVETLEIAAMFDMETNQKTSLQVFVLESVKDMSEHQLSDFKVIDGGFSPDEKYIIAHTNGGVTYCFLVERGKYMYKWGGEEKTYSFSDKESVAFKILPKNYLVQAGMAYKDSNCLYVRNLNNGETIRELKCGGYEIQKFVVNKSYTIGATANSSTTYSSTEGGNKDIYVWNLEKGELISKCIKTKPTNALCFIGDEEQYLLVCNWRETAIEIWYIGTVKHPCLDAIKIHNLIGHSDDVITLHLSEISNTIVTSSRDNTLKFWSLDRVLCRCDDVVKLGGEKMENIAAMKAAITTTECKPCNPTESPVKTTAIAVAP